MREAMPVEAEQPLQAAAESSRSKSAIRSAPERFFETWLDALGGFLFSVVLPIPFYATGEPFAKGIGATEQTILSTAVAYVIVWYCGRRLDAFPRTTLQGNVGYVAPVAAITYAVIAVILLLLRSDYSRIQLFGSGVLTIVWMVCVAQLRVALPDPQLCRGAVEPAAADARNAGLPLADLRGCRGGGPAGRCDGRRSRPRPQRRRRPRRWPGRRSPACRCSTGATSSRRMTGRTPLGGLTPNEFGALLPSRQYLVIRRGLELLLTVLVLPILLPIIAVVALLVRLDSSGPIFFLQNRVGRRGRVFRMVKFRTMHHNAGGPSFTSDRRQARHADRRRAAPLPARRGAAAGERAARRHELGRARGPRR